MKIIDYCEFNEDEDIAIDEFNLRIIIDDQRVETDCIVWLGKIAEVTLTYPYKDINFMFKVEDEKGNFYDQAEAEEYIINALQELMLQIGYVKNYRNEYTTAYDTYQNFRSQRLQEIIDTRGVPQRVRFQMQVDMDKEAYRLYKEKLNELIELPENAVNRERYMIFPTVLKQILKAVP